MQTTTTRRAILAGLAATPVAGLPALAAALPGADPVLAALAEHSRAGAVLNAAFARTAVYSDKLDAMHREIGLVTFQGEEVFSRFMLDHRFSEMEDVTPDIEAEYRAARAAFLKLEPAYHDAFVRSGLREAERAQDEPSRALFNAEDAVLEAEPTTREGALRLLAHVAERLASDSLGDREAELAPAAIRAAVVVLEAGAWS